MPFDIDPSPLIISIATTFTATIVTFFLGIFAARSMQRVRGSARAWIDGGRRVSIWTGTTRGQLQGQYYWGGRPVAFHKGSAAHFQHQDWLGTERLRTTYNGAVEGTFTSLPFGDDQTTGSGTDGDANHFAQLDDDTETETGHAQFRQYSTAQGRWQSPDPYSGSYDFPNPQSFDRYVYALNNPLSAVDPSGLDTQCQITEQADGVQLIVCNDDGNGGDGNPCDSDNTVCVSANPPNGNPCDNDDTVCVSADPPSDPPFIDALNNGTNFYYIPGEPYAVCSAAALYAELQDIKTLTDAKNNELSKTYGTALALLAPGSAFKYGMGGSITGAGLVQTVLAGVAAKTYFVTLPSWLSGMSQAEQNFKANMQTCKNGG